MRRVGPWPGVLATVLICAAASLSETSGPGANLVRSANLHAAANLPDAADRVESAYLLEPASLADLKALYQRPEGIPFPADNPYSEAKAALGQMLFFDPILSGAQNISCATCHNPGLSWADGVKLANATSQMQLHTPTIIDVAWIPVLGWDGKFRTLESVAFGPLLSPSNMNNTEPEIIRRLANIPGYVEAFAQAFPDVKPSSDATGGTASHVGASPRAIMAAGLRTGGNASPGGSAVADAPDEVSARANASADPNTIVTAGTKLEKSEPEITRPRIEQAIATFERTIIATPAPFDRWIEGDETAISASAKRGFVLFNGKAGCANCHEGPSFSDFSFHDIGMAPEDDEGRGRLFPTSIKLRHAFKAPTLRDVARRAPYMHDGSMPTLEAVVDAYDKGGVERPSRSELIHPLGLSAREKRDLLTFLDTLTGSPTTYAVPVLPR